MDLERRWPLTGATALRDRLVAAYADPRRGYHDLLHLDEVLDRLDELRAAGNGFDPVTVRLAAWFHDAVHDAGPDAEERSARLAEDALTRADVPPAVVAEVARLVRLTERHDPDPGDVAGAALCDADLAVLASTAPRYAAYVDGVRREYADVSDPAFRAGRSAVLSALLDRPHLYTTASARDRWEETARANVSRELASLRDPRG